MEQTADRALLISLLRTRSLRTGRFTLASGRESHYYIDARPTTMSAQGLNVIGRLGLREIVAAGWPADAVGGLTLGADPVAYAIAAASLGSDRVLDAFTVRKEPKGHGAGRQVEGAFEAGCSVVIVEDVITTGRSALAAADAVRRLDARVCGVLAVVDRLEGGREAIEAEGYAVRALVTVRDLGVEPAPEQ